MFAQPDMHPALPSLWHPLASLYSALHDPQPNRCDHVLQQCCCRPARAYTPSPAAATLSLPLQQQPTSSHPLAPRHCCAALCRMCGQKSAPPADPVTSPTNLCCSPPTVPTGHAAPSPLAYEPQLTTAGPQDNANAKPSSAGQQGHRDPGCPARGRPAVLWPCPCLPYLLCAHRRCATHTC